MGNVAAALSTLAATCALAVAHAAAAGDGGEVRGRVSLGVAGVPLSAVAPVVVYLEPLDAAASHASPRRSARMRQRDARFSPPFLVVAVGQSLEVANDDAIYHNVFSYSRPNDFDLGLYPAGESRTLVLQHPGVVKMYCSIHESMNATVLVAPSRWFDVVGADGEFALSGVAPGRYRAVAWTERLPAAERVIEVGPDETRAVDWVIGAPSADQDSSTNDAPQT